MSRTFDKVIDGNIIILYHIDDGFIFYHAYHNRELIKSWNCNFKKIIIKYKVLMQDMEVSLSM